MPHRIAKLTPFGRRLLVERILIAGWPPATAAETSGVSRAPHTSGCAATAPRVWPGSRIGASAITRRAFRVAEGAIRFGL